MPSDTLYVFGDQSLDLLPSIQHLSRKCRQNQPLQRFMRAATDNIQHAVSTLPAHLRPEIAPFDSPLQLAEALSGDPSCTPLTSSLLAIAQLGDFILYLSANPCAIDGSQSAPTFLSICTGSLAAAAAASSRNLSEVLQIAPHIVLLAFNIGFEAFKRSQNLETSKASWATIVKDVELADLQPIIESFNQGLDDRCHKRVYISAVGESSVTISGPPSVTRKLFRTTPVLNGAKKISLPITAAFHARHLIPIAHTRIFQHIEARHFKRHLHHRLLSPCSGHQYSSCNLENVLNQIVDEILQQPIEWKTTTRELSRILTPSATGRTFGPFLAAGSLSKWLTTSSGEKIHSQDFVPSEEHLREGSGAIAIIGMALRAPGSETLEDFWDVLREGKDLHKEIPADRFDVNAHCDPSGKRKNATVTPYGVFVDRPGHFDPRFFNMSPREALQTDPQQRLMLLTTYEALENAGYSPNRTPSSNTRRIASFIGQTGDDYREFNASQDVDTYFITGNIRAFGPGRLNYHFGWEGPSYSIDTACSSSGASIQLACSALLSRECDTAVSGGANLLTSPDLFAGLSRGGFLSKTGGCKTFDQDADGYVRGEGCGVLILKRLEDATADRDNILAVIRSAATNHSAEAISITHPHEQTQERLFRAVLNSAGVLPCEVDLAEVHGTGTQAGDAVESRSVTNVLCQNRGADNPLFLSTLKPNIGHGEAASGVSSIIKAVLMMQKDTIPPHIGIKRLINEKLPSFQDLHVNVCSKATTFRPRADGDGKRRILVNNFDAAGGNTCMLLEDPPQLVLAGQDPRSHHIIALSAKSAGALTNNIQSLRKWLDKVPGLRLEDVAYTTTSRRMHYQFRRAFSVTSLEDLATVLESQSNDEPIRRIGGEPSAVFCFTGQGSQYLSMASTLYKTHPTFRSCLNEYASICDTHGFPPFMSVLDGDPKGLDSPVQTQLSIVAIELALAVLWKSWGVQASAVVGHSLGEYSALCYAGVISPSDCLYLVGKRAELIAQKCNPHTHAMLSIQASAKVVKEQLQRVSALETEFACFNSPRSTVVSGPLTAIEALDSDLRLQGLTTKVLPTRHAFHSSQLDVILDDFENFARNVNYAKPEIPVASTTLGEVVVADEVIGPTYLKSQTRKCVRFEDAIEALHAASIANDATVWVEMGPSATCLSMVKATRPGVRTTLPSLQQHRDDWQTLGSSLASAYNAGLNIDWNEFHRPLEHSLQLVQLPNYCYDLKNYWIYEGHKFQASRSEQPKAQYVEVTKLKDRFSATESVHRIENLKHTEDVFDVTFATNASEPIINRALCGHSVDGVALCPSSIYADMAFAAASYLRDISGIGPAVSIEINDMEVSKPLIIEPGNTKQVIFINAVKKHVSNDIQVRYSSQNGTHCQTHAECVAKLIDSNMSASASSRNAYLVRDRISYLHQASRDGEAHRLLKPMVYKLFKAFVDYHREYQGLEEVFLNTHMLEAAAVVNFYPDNSKFTCNPYWIDSIAHLSGFILNGSEFTPADSVFISHGWKSLKILQTLHAGKRYLSYVRMQEGTRNTILSGDVYVFDDDRLVAICEDLKFQKIKRNVLNCILPKREDKISGQNAHKSGSSSFQLPRTEEEIKPVQEAVQLEMPLESSSDLILKILATELETEPDCLDEEAEFASLGIDSLMAVNILTALRTQLKINLPASVFAECRSIKELRECLARGSDLSTEAGDRPTQAEVAGSSNSDMITNTGSTSPNPMPQLFEVLARELGMDVDDLEDDALFTDLGVDSLLTMNILSTLGDMVGEVLPASLFMQYPTVADLRGHLQDMLWRSQPEPISQNDGDNMVIDDQQSVGQITPATELGDYRDEGCLAHRSIITEIMRKIVAEELGLSTTEIEDDAQLMELGVDSLLTISILWRVREQTGLNLAPTFFHDNPTFSAIESTLVDTPLPRTGGANPAEKSPAPELARDLSPQDSKATNPEIWNASSILLQGSISCREPCLFLIPDGSGSSSSYIGLPCLENWGAVYGLNSPFLANPDSFKMSLQELVTLYVDEMLRIQPTGPFHIGGWSFGGICAFEAASQLIRRHGQDVSSLLLIDAPCPTLLPPLPVEDIDFLQSIGVFETIKDGSKTDGLTSAAQGLRSGVREHFVGSVNALEQYEARAIEESRAPQSVTLIWARNGVWNELGEEMSFLTAGVPKSEHPTTSWLMDTRPSYGTCGWDDLLPSSNFTCHTVQGDHFSIMRKPGVLQMGRKISSSLTRA